MGVPSISSTPAPSLAAVGRPLNAGAVLPVEENTSAGVMTRWTGSVEFPRAAGVGGFDSLCVPDRSVHQNAAGRQHGTRHAQSLVWGPAAVAHLANPGAFVARVESRNPSLLTNLPGAVTPGEEMPRQWLSGVNYLVVTFELDHAYSSFREEQGWSVSPSTGKTATGGTGHDS
jgi:hypothetical protein